jgi:hypothetical protein
LAEPKLPRGIQPGISSEDANETEDGAGRTELEAQHIQGTEDKQKMRYANLQ